jgi:hypothetical protein
MASFALLNTQVAEDMQLLLAQLQRVSIFPCTATRAVGP